MENHQVEYHPLKPFLPDRAVLLMLGSFPPPRKRWSMDFYYPNFNNDMWRIFGWLFFGDKNYFVEAGKKSFDSEKIIDFLKNKGVAIFDSATAIRRLKDNAADQFLEVVEFTDVPSLLRRIPRCKAIVTTGQKSTDTLRTQFVVDEPKVGGFAPFSFEGRKMKLFRMPSSSRAYPLALEKKASIYRTMFADLGMI